MSRLLSTTCITVTCANITFLYSIRKKNNLSCDFFHYPIHFRIKKQQHGNGDEITYFSTFKVFKEKRNTAMTAHLK